MTIEIIVQIILFGIALAMDAFAVSVTSGLIYRDLNKKKALFIAADFGIMQAIMPLLGFFIIELFCYFVGESGSAQAEKAMSTVITWISFSLLLFIGGKMLVEGIRDVRSPEQQKEKDFSYKEILVMGVATAIDAMAVGVSLHAGISTFITVWLHAAIIMAITFGLSLAGTLLGGVVVKLFRGKYELTVVVGGSVLILLGIWVVLSHYLNW